MDPAERNLRMRQRGESKAVVSIADPQHTMAFCSSVRPRACYTGDESNPQYSRSKFKMPTAIK